MTHKRILCIGDSLTEFFDWQGRFPDHEVKNLGRAGETVEGLLGRLEAVAARRLEPDMVFLMTGINNVAMDDLGFLGAYREVLRRLLAAYPKARLFAQGLLPTRLPWISGDAILRVNRSLKELAEEEGASYIDLHPLFLDAEGEASAEYLLPDGVHISERGYAVWSGRLEGLISEKE